MSALRTALTFTLACLCASLAAGCAAAAEVAPADQEAAECMIGNMQAAPNMEEVRIGAATDKAGAHPVIAYRFTHDGKSYGAQFALLRGHDGALVYNLKDAEGPLGAQQIPITRVMEREWQVDCGIGGVTPP